VQVKAHGSCRGGPAVLGAVSALFPVSPAPSYLCGYEMRGCVEASGAGMVVGRCL
jgi:hypothetical protein